MIKTQMLGESLIRHYSDSENMALKQVETGNIYEDAIDVLPCRYTYVEVEKLEEIVGN